MFTLIGASIITSAIALFTVYPAALAWSPPPGTDVGSPDGGTQGTSTR